MKNMTLKNIAEAVNGKLIAGTATRFDIEAACVVTDSRLCETNGIFVAIKGEKTDGHDYIEKILDDGALGAICEKLPTGYEKRTSGAYILVDDCLKALRLLASYYRRQLDVKIVGIVGSVGKTSTKELVASVLSQNFETQKTAGNYNNEIGVPITLFSIRENHRMAVVEMGISGFGEMDRLGEMVKPDMVVMTNIGPCHLENLKDLDGVLRAKSEVLRHIKSGGMLVINSDDPKLLSLKKLKNKEIDCDIIDKADQSALENLSISCYGSNGDASYSDFTSLGFEGSTFTLKLNTDGLSCFKEHEIRYSIPCEVHMQGIHMVMNSLAAAIIGHAYGMTKEQVAKGIASAVPMRGRCCPIKTDKYLIVDDSYNANPKSMMAAIDLVAESKGRKVMILGDMFELGTDEESLHYQVGEYAAGKIDLLICVGRLSEKMYQGWLKQTDKKNGSTPSSQAYYYKDREQLLSEINTLGFMEGDIILVKASHGMKFYGIVDKLAELGTRFHFVKGREKMQIDDIMQLLAQTHWACKRSRETVEKAIENSLCFGIIDSNGKQIAFGRTVTDYATMFYVSDVVVDKDLQKHGLGRRFVEFIKSAEELKYLWGFLGTTKAKKFYQKCGFEPKDDFFMAMPKTNVNGIFNV